MIARNETLTGQVSVRACNYSSEFRHKRTVTIIGVQSTPGRVI